MVKSFGYSNAIPRLFCGNPSGKKIKSLIVIHIKQRSEKFRTGASLARLLWVLYHLILRTLEKIYWEYEKIENSINI